MPIRQWVVTLPPRVRYLLAWDHALCRAVVGVSLRAVAGWLRRRAVRRGLRGGRAGAVVIVQRFGGALNLNVHLHALVADGVFTEVDGRVRFHRATPARPGEMAALAVVIARRVRALLERRGLWEDTGGLTVTDPWADEQPLLAGLAAAAIQQVGALGSRAGWPVRRWGDGVPAPEVARPSVWHARHEGFDVHAAVAVPARARERLERLCRYALRAPLGQTRLERGPRGTVALALRRRWSDGTTHVLFDPLELLERLAALVPRPRINLVLYYGVFAPRAAWRASVVPGRGTVEGSRPDGSTGPRANRSWAALMQRSFGFEVLVCPRCAGRLRIIALIHQPAVIERILRHLGLPDAPPVFHPSRDPPRPGQDLDIDLSWSD